MDVKDILLKYVSRVDEERLKHAMHMARDYGSNERDFVYETCGYYLKGEGRSEVEKNTDDIDVLYSMPELFKGMHTCIKCGSSMTRAVPKMTKSADEGLSTVITCTNCGARWMIEG